MATDQAELVAALKDTLRILKAVRMSAGLGKGQIERMEKAEAALRRVERDPEARG